MRVLFWGTPDFALPAFRALGEEGFHLAGVVTQPDRPAGRGRSLRQSAVKEAAVADGVPVLQPERAKGPEFIEAIRRLEPEISVVVAFGQILPQEVLDLPPFGSVNIHASLLPELRGAAPVQWAIIRGHERSGVTLMRMERGLDSGPILLQVPEPMRADESGTELAMRLSEIGAEAMVETLALLSAGMLEERVQDHDRATYAPKLDRETARVDWKLPAAEIARWVRGLDNIPGAWSPIEGSGAVKLFRPRVEIREGAPGSVLAADEEGVLIAAGDAAVRIREVQPPGKRRMPAAAWVRGRGVAAGDRFG